MQLVNKLWIIAWRDLGRNRRRTLFSLIAVALGLGLLILLNGYIAGAMEDSLQNNIRLRTGHIQLRAPSYEEGKLSVQWKDLVENATDLAARAKAMPEVAAAAPVLWATGFLNTADDSAGLQLFGIDPTSALYAPIQTGVVAGEYLAPDDRGGILLGQRLASSLGIGAGEKVSLAVVNADGEPDEAVFTVRGLFSTGIPSYDDNAVFMPLAKAQALLRTGERASAVVMLLHNQDDADRVAAALGGSSLTALTWRELNALWMQTMQVSMKIYTILDAIVMLIVAVVIANTLLMAVFERIREVGILAALGMTGRQIMLMFLLEATILGVAGIAVGIALGLAGVWYLATAGLYIGNMASTVQNAAIGTTLYARFVPGTFALLSLSTLVIIWLASLYPAWFAARLEPVAALHSL